MDGVLHVALFEHSVFLIHLHDIHYLTQEILP